MYSDEVQRAAHLLRSAKYAVAFTGAGISTPSGIPDFRSPNSGLWHGTNPLMVASMYGFRQNPQAFYDWVYPLAELTLNAVPNPAHEVLARWEAQGYLKAIITQNIDMLHTRAGSKTVYELHGHLREVTCIHCFTAYPAEPIIRQFLADHQVPHCPKCGDVLKLNVILFGEQLPFQAILDAQNSARKTDLMLIIGSSIEVAPASDLPVLASRNGAKLVIINREPTHMDANAEVVIHDDAAQSLPEIMTCLETLP